MSNAKAAAPSGTSVKLSGKEYVFKYGTGLLRKIEALTGIDGWKINWGDPSLRETHAVIWATVELADKRSYTAEQIDDLFPITDPDIQEAVGAAMGHMLLEALNERQKKLDARKEKEAPTKKGKASKSSTGSATGASAESA